MAIAVEKGAVGFAYSQRHGPDWVHNLHEDLQQDMDTVLALSGVQDWLRLVRAPSEGKLDIEATADRLGIPLLSESDDNWCRGETLGLPFDNPKEALGIYLAPWNEEHRRRFTMGHELGHLYLEVLGYRHHEFSRVAENFCDAVAREVTMPQQALEKLGVVNEEVLLELTTDFGLELNDVLLRLISRGKLPPKVAVDSGMGESPNEKYHHKICRSYVCFNCYKATMDQIDCRPADFEVPVFDFTDKDWWPKLGLCMNEPDYFWDDKLREELNERYGRSNAG